MDDIITCVFVSYFSPVSQIGSELQVGRKSLEVVRVNLAYSARTWPAHAVRYDLINIFMWCELTARKAF